MTTVTETPFFDQIGISYVVWLDDLFEKTEGANEVDIVEQVATALAAGVTIVHPKLGDLTRDDSPQEWARRIRERLSQPEIEEFLTQIKPPEEGARQQVVDYSPGELEQVVSSLASAVERLGFGAWPNEKDRLIAGGAEGVFLVDLERQVGGQRIAVGGDIVKELIARCSDEVIVVVLTHSIGPEGTEALRHSLASELDVPVARLGVVSKRPADASLTNGIRAAVRVTLTQLTCTVVTSRIVTAMKKSLDETQTALGTLPVSALDQAIFENSFVEGASEIDVLSRILLSRERTSVDAHVAGALEQVHSPLSRMRRLRLLEKLPVLPPGDATLLRQWRRDEVFDLGRTLNALRAPLGCGDVFIKESTQKYFMLLGQPCDLMVRANGQRTAREAVLIKLATSYTPSPSLEGRFFEVPALEGVERWALDFRAWVSVSLECLEWTSFNDDGQVAFRPSDHPPTGLLPGWEKRFESANNKFQNGRKYQLTLGDLPSALVEASADNVVFPYRRVARLRAPRAAGAYAAFNNFHARGAFDHDFTKGLAAQQETEEVPEAPDRADS